MANPWLTIPLADYEGHMNSPEVQQLTALSDLFVEAVAFCRPISLAILGIAGGNGLDRIDSNITHRIIGLDLNPLYLEVVRQRYPHLRGLETHCIDLAEEDLDLEPVELVHAGLVFEHAGVDRCLENAVSLVAKGGALSVVLQLPSEITHKVGSSNFASIQNLASQFTLIDPTWLRKTLQERGFRMKYEARRALVAGKAFWLGIFGRERR
jgi:hypothetical protein